MPEPTRKISPTKNLFSCQAKAVIVQGVVGFLLDPRQRKLEQTHGGAITVERHAGSA